MLNKFETKLADCVKNSRIICSPPVEDLVQRIRAKREAHSPQQSPSTLESPFGHPNADSLVEGDLANPSPRSNPCPLWMGFRQATTCRDCVLKTASCFN